MRRKTFIIPIIAVAIFFVGFYNKPITEYFNRIETIFGLLYVIIMFLIYFVFREKEKKVRAQNDYHYSTGEQNGLRNIISIKDSIIQEQKYLIDKLLSKIEDK